MIPVLMEYLIDVIIPIQQGVLLHGSIQDAIMEQMNRNQGGKQMDFFSKLGETISATGKDVTQKAKDLTGLAKLNIDLKAKEDFIQHQYTEVGKQYYELHKDDVEPLFEEINLIAETFKEIEQLKAEMIELRGQKKCFNCGAVMDLDAIFCNRCGTKYDSVFEEEDTATKEEDTAAKEEDTEEEVVPEVELDKAAEMAENLEKADQEAQVADETKTVE